MKAIFVTFKGFGILVTQANVSLQTAGLATQFLKITDQCEYLVKLIETIESAKFMIKEAVQAIEELDFGEDFCSINRFNKKKCKAMTFLK